MIQNGGEEEDNHEDERTIGNEVALDAGGEEADQAELSDVDANGQLLKRLCVEGALGVDVSIEDVEEVVAHRQVNEDEADCCETQNQRRNA